MDDAVLGGEKSELDGGKRGRSGPNKTPFVVAVETSDDGRPLRLLLHVVKVHDGAEIESMAKAHLEPHGAHRLGQARLLPCRDESRLRMRPWSRPSTDIPRNSHVSAG